jgi:hypothetical protein
VIALQSQKDPDEDRDIQELIDEVITDSGQWLDTPNDQLGGFKPKELIWQNPDDPKSGHHETESVVRNLLRAAKNGIFS